MDFKLRRLRRGEIVAGAGGIVLLLSLALPWYGAHSAGGSVTATGWEAHSILHWLILADGLAALGLAVAQARCLAPALPVTLTVIDVVIGIPTALALVYRVLVNLPGPDSLVGQRAGAFIGLAAALAIVYGAGSSMRQEGIAPGDAVATVPTVGLGRPGDS